MTAEDVREKLKFSDENLRNAMIKYTQFSEKKEHEQARHWHEIANVWLQLRHFWREDLKTLEREDNG